MIGAVRRLWRSSGGAAAVEFAFVIGPLLLLMFGVFEFARLLWTREAMQETASAGARCMGMSSSACQGGGAYSAANTQAYIEGVATSWGVPLTNADLTLASDTTCAGVTAPNGFSTVIISYTFESVVPNLIGALGGGTALSTTACFPNN
ncbi:MAG TPA: TadE/TadG family type IV pilus assembly protein [Caulobacteraceae bacterium]|nr:TadE/TadG family type IV pilus assembly protein [Caulobacteraceae bacterium]